jgi:hypothetical protein
VSRIDVAKAALGTAEASIRKLVGDAASAGAYEEVLLLTNFAKAVATLANSVASSHIKPPAATYPATTGVQIPRRISQQSSSKTAKGGKKSKLESYPRFIRANGDLVKIGWSKSAGKEYQHKAPQSVISVVADAIKVQRIEDGVLRPPQEFLPLTLPSGETIPDYQSYLCIAWLRDIGVVERHGRHGYSVPDPASIQQRVEQAWNQLSNS